MGTGLNSSYLNTVAKELNIDTCNESEVKEEIKVMTESLWGDVDILDDVADNPFLIAPDTYFATCTEATIEESDDGNQLKTVWTITQPDSEFDGMSVREYGTLPIPGVSYEGQPTKIKQSLRYLKSKLRRGFDLSEKEMVSLNKTNLDSLLLGKEAYIVVVNNPVEKNGETIVYNNLKAVISKRAYEEENDVSTAQTNSEFGL